MRIFFLSILLSFFCSLAHAQDYALQVPCIDTCNVEAEQIPQIMQQNGVEYFPVSTMNWPEYSYCPNVEAAIAYADDCVLLHFRADTKYVVANVAEDFGSVFHDCCVEWFVSPVDDGTYYNIECNCLGYIYMQHNKVGGKHTAPPADVLPSIKRWTSLGRDSLGIVNNPTHWEVALAIPYSAFFKHNIKSLKGRTIRANFQSLCSFDGYRYYLSWTPVPNEKLTFHHLPKGKLISK